MNEMEVGLSFTGLCLSAVDAAPWEDEKWGRLDFSYSLLNKSVFKWTLMYKWQLKTVDESVLFELFPKVEGREKCLDKET